MNRNSELKAQYPRIDDPECAIAFALSWQGRSPQLALDFLSTWRDGAWDEIEQAYPEFLERGAKCAGS